MRRGGRAFEPIDILIFAALTWVVLAAPQSVQQSAWVDRLDNVTLLALGGLVAGTMAARSVAPAWLGYPVGIVLGAEAVLFAFANTAPPGNLHDRAAWIVGRLGVWVETIAANGASSDTLIFALTMGALAWVLGFVSAWLVFRDQSPWLAVVVNAVALLVNLSYSSPSFGAVMGPFLFSAGALVVLHGYARRRLLWQETRLEVEPHVGRKIVAGSVLTVALFLSLAWTLPPGGTNDVVTASWDRVSTPWQGIEREFDRFFSALNASERASRGLNFGRTLAPRGSFELSDTPVMEIRSPRPLYWRATTADRYTGQVMTTGDTEESEVPANSPLTPSEAIPLARDQITVTVKLLANRSPIAFIPEAPVQVDRAVDLETRGSPDDIAAVRFSTPLGRDQQYTLTAAISSASEQQLREAGQDYPAWVRQRYLQVPRRLPRRVVELARNLTREAATPYDRAARIEDFLRSNFTYSTHLGEVPPDRDWVDYLLFDSKEGYCDYFASAMVVMLRSVGVPARVASGFAPGDFDAERGVWVVRENHAHSWVEVYFPQYGWITFEPSAIRSVPGRDGLEQPQLDSTPVAETPAASDLDGQVDNPELEEFSDFGTMYTMPDGQTTVPTWVVAVGGGLLGLVALAGLAFGIVWLIWRRTFGKLPVYQQPYAQLVGVARWVGAVRPARAQTPYEVAAVLARELPAAGPAIRDLADAYVEGTYAGRMPAIDAGAIWHRIRRQLARLLARRRLARLVRRPRRDRDTTG